MSTKEKRPVRNTGAKPRPAQAAGKGRQPVRRRRRSDGEIVYTPAKHFNRYHFFLHLVTVVAVVLALTLGMAIFFKVQVVTVSGMEKYTAWDIREASGIQEGDNLLTLNKAKAGGKITTALPYVDTVRIGIKLPDTVNIEITELTVVYAIQDTAGIWWLIDAEGVLLEDVTGIEAEACTRIQGVKIQSGQAGQMAVAAEEVPATQPPTDEEETEQEQIQPEAETEEGSVPPETLEVAPVTVFAAEQLKLALEIVNCLEDSGVIGAATVVDVTDPYDLQLWYEDRYQVFLGESANMDYKIAAMVNAVGQMTDYQRGKLDVSFTQWPDMVGYTPFEE